MSPSPAIGVDIVEWKRAKAFYHRHRAKLSSFLTEREMNYMSAAGTPHRRLAMLLAAKEAVFKAGNKPWMGPSGFAKIRLLPRKDGGFSCGPLRVSLHTKKIGVIAVCAGN